MQDMKSPPCAGTAGDPSQHSFGGEVQTDHNATADRWEVARALERSALDRARSALILRGGERLQQCAIATALAFAARNAALAAGGSQ